LAILIRVKVVASVKHTAKRNKNLTNMAKQRDREREQPGLVGDNVESGSAPG
jgi:hypothetical protein